MKTGILHPRFLYIIKKALATKLWEVATQELYPGLDAAMLIVGL